jgi:AraC-like DNA-binding protein
LLSERLADASIRLAAMDVLSQVLGELRFASASYRWIELGSPFALGFNQAGLRGVHIVAEGQCDLVVDGDITRLGQGDLVVLPRGDDHVLRSVSARRTRVESGFALAMRTPGVRLRAGGPSMDTIVVCGAFIVGEPDHPALLGLPRVIHVPADDASAWLTPYLDAIRAEAVEPGLGGEVVLARLSDALLVRALRRQAGSAAQRGWLAGLGDPYVAVALEAMHDDLAKPWSLPSLARVSGLSRAAFAARFSQRVGQAPMTYLQALRMHRARTLLRDERLTIATVAERVGYRSGVAFAAAFKRLSGSSPAAYRRADRGA